MHVSFYNQRAFTLVELAIVITIIGLLIGGVLKGQEMIQNARVTATIAQVQSFEAAVNAFRDRYDALPGDMPNAALRIPGCNANCNPAPSGAGNSIVGWTDWGTTQGYTSQGAGTLGHPPSDIRHETWLFFTHLLLADLVSGVSDTAIRQPGTTSNWGVTHPSAPLGGGFMIGYARAVPLPGSPAAVGPSGHVLGLMAQIVGGGMTSGNTSLQPQTAAQIDRKIDDGLPGTGYVQAYGGPTCFSGSGAEATYNETVVPKVCGLTFRIQ